MTESRAVLTFLTVVTCLMAGQSATNPDDQHCEPGVNCQLPECYCANMTDGPPNVRPQQRPQIVVLTFNDAVNERNFRYYQDMLSTGWKNSNGCPVSLTLFVSDSWTNYTQVQKLWLSGAEIAAFGTSGYAQTFEYYRTLTKEQLMSEISTQKRNFVTKAKIPPDAIKGFRMPYFLAGGDAMVEALAEQKYTYDATLIVSWDSTGDTPTWPATLTYPWPFPCKHGQCPGSNNSSLWEIPVTLLWNLNEQYECQYIDACINNPKDEEGAFQLFWRNFLRYYRTRTPFILNMRSTWLNTDYQRTAFHRLVHSMLEMPEVYMVTASQLIEWMQNATSLEDLNHFSPWLCPQRHLHNRAELTTATTGGLCLLLVLGTALVVLATRVD